MRAPPLNESLKNLAKTCTTCGQVKSGSDFYSKGPGRIDSSCKECIRAKKTRHRQQTKIARKTLQVTRSGSVLNIDEFHVVETQFISHNYSSRKCIVDYVEMTTTINTTLDSYKGDSFEDN